MPTSLETAGQVMEVVPLVMRTMRAEMRARRGRDLSVPAFRALGYIRRHPGASLSALAEHIGLTLPSASKLVEGLVERRLVMRRVDVDDRRRMTLDLTAKGRDLLESAYNSALGAMARYLARLSDQERADVLRAMEILNPIFAGSIENEIALHAVTAVAHEPNDRRVAVR